MKKSIPLQKPAQYKPKSEHPRLINKMFPN